MTPDLTELETHGFKAVVPVFLDMPAMKVMPIFELDEGVQQMRAMQELLRDTLPVDKLNEFDNLSLNQVMDLLMKWVQTK